MKRTSPSPFQLAILIATLCLALAPVSMQVYAQTPESEEPSPTVEVPPPTNEETPPPPTEETETPPVEESDPPQTETPPPPVDDPETPTDENPSPPGNEESDNEPAEPTETTEPVQPDTTEEAPATETPDPTSTGGPDQGESEPATETPEPTPTETPEVPDELELTGPTVVTMNAGEQRDFKVRYKLGSDRDSTEISLILKAPGGESLEGWTVEPVNRADLLDDPNDTARHFKAKVREADVNTNGDHFETTWRITAPDHIETSFAIRVDASAVIQKEDGIHAGDSQNDLIQIQPIASGHNPTLTCDEVVAEDVDNTWNCSFDTTHPDDDVVITVAADVPAGWNLALDDAELSGEPLALSADAISTDSFTLAATYPIGCPDINATFSASVSLSMTYPSGEVSELDAEFPLVFKRPTPTFEITAFDFAGFDMRETLSTTGELTISYDNVPCAWQATIELSDFQTDDFSIPNVVLSVISVDGLPESSVTFSDNTIAIVTPDSDTEVVGGAFTIHLGVELPHQIPPGSYQIGVQTQFVWEDGT